VLKEAAARLGTRAGYCRFDASDPEAIAAALLQLPERVDVLVNNAGGNTDVAFLAAPEAGHITGQVIHVNGGAYLGR
jgi:3-oxoacyl-[acyl-carrier protein] reductase